ncbi:MAG: hypothetical protein DSY46_00855 [Hydrogenimonas sp.]|nr:MAG: hypothetical protein DSY46_00855 [Hydrogenimonas sp.]
MIYGLTPVQASMKFFSRLNQIEINALLQLGIKVLSQEKDGAFLIKMGQHTFTTKSETALQPGREYWVDLHQSREGIVYLKRLLPKPLLLTQLTQPLFDGKFLEELPHKKEPAGAFKEYLLQALASASNKEQFQTLTQLLLALHQGIFSLPIYQDGKKMLLQMRQRKKNKNLNQKSIEFYAAMNNIGPIEGKIVQFEDQCTLTLEVYYPKSVHLLQQHINSLKGFDHININLSSAPIHPFWEGEQSGLLDIKG